jgi:hypothetical protein
MAMSFLIEPLLQWLDQTGKKAGNHLQFVLAAKKNQSFIKDWLTFTLKFSEH